MGTLSVAAICLLSSLAFVPAVTMQTSFGQPSLSSVDLGTVPRGVAVNSNSGLIYAVLYLNGTTVALDPQTLGTVFRVVTPSPYTVTVNSLTNKVYVSQGERASLVVIDGSVGSVVALIQGAGTPYAMAVDETHNLVFGADTAGNSLWIINGSTNTVAARVPMGDTSALAYDPSINEAFIGNLSSDFKKGTVDVVNVSSQSLVQTVQVSIPPTRFAVDPSSHILFVTSGGAGTGSSSANLLAIDDRTFQVVYSKHLGSSPDIMSVTPTSKVYISDPGDNRLYELDCRTGELLLNLTGGSASGVTTIRGITGMAFSPHSGKLYITEREVTRLIVLDPGVTPVSGPDLPPYVYLTISISIGIVIVFAIIIYRRRPSLR